MRSSKTLSTQIKKYVQTNSFSTQKKISADRAQSSLTGLTKKSNQNIQPLQRKENMQVKTRKRKSTTENVQWRPARDNT